MDRPELPDDTQQVASFTDLNPAFCTLERASDGAVYLVTWWYGEPTVIAMVGPSGEVYQDDEI